ncbi:hypothetical protein FRC05_009557 [Tulasnella sp. 425]|nr:hypothetical protein FRC05_009557 [Tulasnella sp. 425]
MFDKYYSPTNRMHTTTSPRTLTYGGTIPMTTTAPRVKNAQDAQVSAIQREGNAMRLRGGTDSCQSCWSCFGISEDPQPEETREIQPDLENPPHISMPST